MEKKEGLETSRKIHGAYPNSFAGFTVVGPRGIGKSSYGLRAIHEVYMRMGYTENQAWKQALRCCKFHIIEVISFLKESTQADTQEPCLLWDDVGIHGSSGKYFLQMKMVDLLKGVMDSIRTAVSGIILTAPSQKGILSFLTNYDDHVVLITYSPEGGFYRIATGYKWRTLPSGKRLIHKRYKELFNVRLPNWVYDEYMVMRKKALVDALGKLEKTVKE